MGWECTLAVPVKKTSPQSTFAGVRDILREFSLTFEVMCLTFVTVKKWRWKKFLPPVRHWFSQLWLNLKDVQCPLSGPSSHPWLVRLMMTIVQVNSSLAVRSTHYTLQEDETRQLSSSAGQRKGVRELVVAVAPVLVREAERMTLVRKMIFFKLKV